MPRNKSGRTQVYLDYFADFAEPPCPCLLLLDTSASMSGAAIAELNAGVSAFKNELTARALHTKKVEVAVVTFGPVQVRNTFQSVSDFLPAHLDASGDAPMGAAIRQGIELLEQRKGEYRAYGIAYARPTVFLMTNGLPTDDWQSAASLMRQEDSNHRLSFYAVAVSGANMEVLHQISAHEPVNLAQVNFCDFILDFG